MWRLSTLFFLCAVTVGDAREFVIPELRNYDSEDQLDHSKRVHSYPYITSDGFRAACDFWIDEARVPFDPCHVKTGDIIYLNPYYLDFFFDYVHPEIKVPYVLLTTNSTVSCPGKYACYLDERTLACWFTKNPDYRHPKLKPIPLGFANAYFSFGDVRVIKRVRTFPSQYRDVLLLMNFKVADDRIWRKPVYDLFKNEPFCYNAPQKSFYEYLYDMSRSKFLLSPAGAGVDCYRTWEALLFGCIPIVKRSTIDSLFKDLPVVIIDDWRQVTRDFLEKKYKQMSKIKYRREKLFMPYWLNKIKKAQKKVRIRYGSK